MRVTKVYLKTRYTVQFKPPLFHCTCRSREQTHHQGTLSNTYKFNSSVFDLLLYSNFSGIATKYQVVLS